MEHIKALSVQFNARRLYLFGSRARGDHRPDSDYDFALWGVPAERQAAFLHMVDELLPSLLKIDVVFVGPQTDPKLIANIEKDGIKLMDKFEIKYDNFKNAMARLQDGLCSYEGQPDALIRDGIIQRFEFTCELAWKTVREYLLDQGYADLNSPKAVMKQALADGLISDGDGWMALLTDRNLTSHLYDEASANQIFERIRTQHIDLLGALLEKLK